MYSKYKLYDKKKNFLLHRIWNILKILKFEMTENQINFFLQFINLISSYIEKEYYIRKKILSTII